ncbi:F-box protein PP2-B10 [Cardamine amara subsp. amara]|uniref:F-box protein PP2-B10 n=1 Tax=Cardamine amara subsp. amara TaxID=228776 RepID=A0ABD1BZU8_CARAN
MTKTFFAIKCRFRKFVERLKKTLRLSASDQSHKSSPFDSLPEVCISIIISFTSPRDACVVASVSRTFESAVKSSIVWEKFIPPEYPSLVPRWQYYSSKKELYFALCNDSVLIDDDNMSLWIEKATGKRCIMLSAMSLTITIMHGDSLNWDWIPYHEARFESVLKLLKVRWFEICGRMNTHVLSPRARYSVYIVFKITDQYDGFADAPIEVVVRVVGQESSRRSIYFDEIIRRGWERMGREDVWMEIELGKFFN